MIKEKEGMVRKILRKHPVTRDDYNKLISTYWSEELKELGINIHHYNAHEFLMLMWSGKLSSTESITRCRRKVQEVTPELRGKTYKVRQEECQVEVIEDLDVMSNTQIGLGF